MPILHHHDESRIAPAVRNTQAPPVCAMRSCVPPPRLSRAMKSGSLEEVDVRLLTNSMTCVSAGTSQALQQSPRSRQAYEACNAKQVCTTTQYRSPASHFCAAITVSKADRGQRVRD